MNKLFNVDFCFNVLVLAFGIAATGACLIGMGVIIKISGNEHLAFMLFNLSLIGAAWRNVWKNMRFRDELSNDYKQTM